MCLFYLKRQLVLSTGDYSWIIVLISLFFAIDLEETPNTDHTPSDYSLEVGVNRLDEIRKLLKEDYKLNKHQQQEALG